MPVSHLGLTVSHVPSATSFYLAALQPLGYRFVGARGDSIGLGIYDADFFLTQAPNGYRLAPTHIAFTADDSLEVRECYVAALKAGAIPSGAPGYREDDCDCFNAAVEDQDGNTVEFIWRDSETIERHEPILDYSRARPPMGRSQTSRDLPRSPPGAGLQRASTEPVDNLGSKTLFGVALGAAVGVAASYMIRNDRNDPRGDPRDGPRRVSRYESYDDNRARRPEYRSSRSTRSASVASGDKPHRRSSGGSRGSRYPSELRALDSKPYQDDEEVAYFRTRVTTTSQGRSRAVEAIEYAPASRFTTKRSSTMPMERVEEPVRESRRGSVPESRSRSRRDSVVSGAPSKASRHSTAVRVKSSTSQASTSKPTKKVTTYHVASPSQIPLPDSVVSRSRESSSRRSRAPEFDAYYLDEPEDIGDLSDSGTIVPDDSISCVGLPRASHSSRRESKADKAGSVMTLPIRGVRDDYSRIRTAWSNT